MLSIFLITWLPIEVIGITSTQYNGNVNVTIFGTPCQHWNQKVPHSHSYNDLEKNFCRDPSSSTFLWCYTSDPNIRWDICDPRILSDIPSNLNILINDTGSNCIKEECCNMTWVTFRQKIDICDPRIFVRNLFYYYIPNTSHEMVRFTKKYVVATFFTIFQFSGARSQLDCAYKCLRNTECNGFTYSDEGISNTTCGLGKFNTPDAVKSLLDFNSDGINYA